MRFTHVVSAFLLADGHITFDMAHSVNQPPPRKPQEAPLGWTWNQWIMYVVVSFTMEILNLLYTTCILIMRRPLFTGKFSSV
jgi:hypothetical protein